MFREFEQAGPLDRLRHLPLCSDIRTARDGVAVAAGDSQGRAETSCGGSLDIGQHRLHRDEQPGVAGGADIATVVKPARTVGRAFLAR